MLTLAAIALIVPAAFRATLGAEAAPALGSLSIAISIVLLGVYALNLVFALVTHASLFSGSHAGGTTAGDAVATSAAHAVATSAAHVAATTDEHAPTWSLGRALGVLAGATALVAWMSEILVGAIEPSAEALGLNDVFVGVFVVAILGNAAEHATAVTAAMKDRMDLSLSIAIGSSVQVALFVAPLLVLTSYFVGPAPMDLAFAGGLVLTVLLAVLICGQVAGDGRSDWLKGAQLLAVYAILGLTFFFAPVPGSP
jgi:Ca2+:H+ antiporter